VALQYLEPEQVITAGDAALKLVVPGSSVAEIKAGDALTVEQLIEAMLLPSGNDAAYLLAVEAGRIIEANTALHASEASQRFVARMNEAAKELGMTGTHFVNPDGIHKADHYTTFDDLVTMAELALKEPTITRYSAVATDNVTLGGRPATQWKNTNELVHPESEYYCPYAIGLKTGQTPSAGSCLLSAMQYKGTTYIIGVFGCPEAEDRFDDTLQLFNKSIGIQ
jgi:D-alanyl-D-alanine carboxypeptidase (penicillin-binding protein 5/6)